MKDKDKELLIQVKELVHANQTISILFTAPRSDPRPSSLSTPAGELLRDVHYRAGSRGSDAPQRRRQEVLETATLPAEGLWNLLRAQRENQGQGSKRGL